MATVAALIRGINVGGNKKLPMADLRELLEDMGYSDVRTLLNSGNAVFGTSDSAAKVEKAVAARLLKQLDLDVGVMVRTAKQLAAVVEASPLAGVADDPKRHFVSFLSAAPKASVLKELASEDFEPERFVPAGRELYIWCPAGVQDSRLLKALGERRLGVRATVRNWNTVTKVAAMAAGD
jgi:uncharacterized protein (DUF1697 family)